MKNFDLTYKALFRRYYPQPDILRHPTGRRRRGGGCGTGCVCRALETKKDSIEIGEQIQAFLYRAVYTRALNVLKHRNVEDGYCAAMEEINQRRAEFYQPDNNEVIRKNRRPGIEERDSRCDQ